MKTSKSIKRQPVIRIALSFCILIILTGVGAASAQLVIGAKAGIIGFIEGEVFLDGEAVNLEKSQYVQIRIGQRLATKKGRAEVLLGPDVYVRLGDNASLRTDNNQLDDTRLRLQQGSALIEIVQEKRGIRTLVLVSNSAVEVTKEGLYRLDADSAELRVYGGAALITTQKMGTEVKGGRRVQLNGKPVVTRFDVKTDDSLHQWAARRSFDLFNASSNTRTQNHWRSISLGWAYNANYRMRFRSDFLFADWIKGRQPTLAEVTAAAEQERREREEREYRRRQALKAKIEAEAARTGDIP
ncbi:MAG: hypothetical protein JXA73_06320 [Acidobacteria bacterium]|nr:hypothetical protein [Acidobacteriota bacterium]